MTPRPLPKQPPHLTHLAHLPYPLRALTLAIALAVTGCTAGPDFVRPDAPTAKAYTPGTEVTHLAGMDAAGQTIVSEAAPSKWWTAFGSTALNALVDEGLAHNPDLQSTEATLATARTALKAQTAQSTLPGVTLQAGASRQRALGLPTMGPPTNTYEVYSTVVNAQYDMDLFGAVRRANEAAGAHLDVSRYQYLAQQQTLAANIVTTAIRYATLDAQWHAARQWEMLVRQQAAWAGRRAALGAIGPGDALDADRAGLPVSAQLAQLDAARQQARHGLAVLLGRTPDQAPPPLELGTLQLPQRVPVQVPSSLVRHRPDILAAEASLHEANARLGQATANLYPQIRLTASFGTQSFTPGQFGQDASSVWSWGAGLVQPLFEGGALRDARDAAQTYMYAAQQQYQSAVLHAFRNVADALRTLEADASVQAVRQQTRDDAQRTMAMARQRASLGALAHPELARREADWQQAQLDWLAARGAQLTDTAALFLATGAPVASEAAQ